MNVLVIGRGGREHSMIIHLEKSSGVKELYAAPGSSGIAEHATCVPIDELAIDDLVDFAKEAAIDLTIVGPESSLGAGIADRFTAEGLAIFAPTKAAALLEGSKSFAKEFMEKYDIPTAAYKTFTNADEAKAYIEEQGAPIVIKADGLAEGKGVIVAETKAIALKAIDDMLVDHTFSEAGSTILVEECLFGKEFSLMAFVHEDKVYPMMPARDHKRAYDNDEGPNTGGMGAYAPVEDVTDDILDFVYESVLQKTAMGMIAEGRSFTGILYAGLMLTEAGPKVIEFNTRFGDPETQVVLPLLENDLLQVLTDILAGTDPLMAWKKDACVGVVIASAGYPGTYEKGAEIPSLQVPKNAFIVQAGTKSTDTGMVSSGGRVLLVGALGETIAAASSTVYSYLRIYDENHAFFYRKDIGN